MPREARPAPATPASGTGRQTVFGRPWPLPVAPWVVGLALLLALAAGAAWYFEGRFETTPAEAAKRLLPYKADEVQKVVLTSPAGSVTFNRDAAGSSPPEARLPPPRRCRTPGRPRRRWCCPPRRSWRGRWGSSTS